MVAARVTLLSLAALSSCMFGAFRGAPRSGRLERRLGLADDALLSPLATAGSTSLSTSSSVGSDTATTATQATDSSNASSSTSSSTSDSTSILSTSDDGPCLTCSASATQASWPPSSPSSPSSTSSTILSLSVASSSTSLSADTSSSTFVPETSSSSSVSETSSSSSESETTSSAPESDTATATHYDGRASTTSGAGGAATAAPAPTKKLPPKIPTKAASNTAIMSSITVDFGRPPPPESTSTSVPAAPAPTTSRKLPPAIPTKAAEHTPNMESTTVDFGRPPPAETTSTLAPDMAWPPTDDNYDTSKVPSDVLAGWSSTRGQVEFDWGGVTSTVDDIDDINTWIHVTWPGDWPTVSGGQTRSVCQPSDLLKPSTVYSITHTSTITWTGNPKDYTPPYPPITTPEPCTRIDEDKHSGPQRLTLSRCTSTGTLDVYKTCQMTTVYDVSNKPKFTLTDFEPIPTNLPPVTFITTDKNPAVVFPDIETPDYGYGATTRFNVKNPPGGAERTAAIANNDSPSPSGGASGGGGGGSPGTGGSGSGGGGSGGSGSGGSGNGGDSRANRPVGPPITVSVRAGAVVINDQTFTDSPVLPTQIVRIGGEVFTIEPTRVVGAGATVIRPGTGAGAGAGGAPPATFPPQTTTVGGVPVIVSGRQAVVDGTTFSLDAPATTKTVGDRIVSIGPGGIAVATGASDPNPVRLTPAPAPTPASPQQTEVVVAGGELVTAIGRSVFVIRSTTITYGPAVPATTIDVNGEPVVVGPSGVAMHGTVLGGPNARPGETQYEIVGGATLTQLAPSRVVIRGTTYTVGPGATSTTVVIGRETVTIGPTGVAVSSLSFYYPLGPGYATTITPGATAAAATADPTSGGNRSNGGGGGGAAGAGADGAGDRKKDDAAAGLRPAGLALNLLVSAVAVGLTLWLI